MAEGGCAGLVWQRVGDKSEGRGEGRHASVNL